MKRNIGFENSNSSGKGLSDSRSIHVPNSIRKIRSTSRLNNNLKKNDIYEVNGNLYQFGFDDGYGSGSKDETRYYSEQFRLESGIILSNLCNNGDRLQIVTGLPANLASRDDIISKLKNNLIGSYTVKHQSAIKHFTVDKVSVVSQPIGTLWGILYDIEGNMRPGISEDVLSKDFMFVDIGRGTTDVVVVSASRGIDEEQTITLDIAMQDYIKNLHRAIELELPQSRLTSTGITVNQLDKKLLETDVLDIQTGKFNVGEIKRDLQDEFALQLKQRLDNFGYNLDRYHQIVLTGGGSIVMEQAIKRAFNNNPRIKLIESAILANVTGFYIMARQIYGE